MESEGGAVPLLGVLALQASTQHAIFSIPLPLPALHVDLLVSILQNVSPTPSSAACSGAPREIRSCAPCPRSSPVHSPLHCRMLCSLVWVLHNARARVTWSPDEISLSSMHQDDNRTVGYRTSDQYGRP